MDVWMGEWIFAKVNFIYKYRHRPDLSADISVSARYIGRYFGQFLADISVSADIENQYRPILGDFRNIGYRPILLILADILADIFKKFKSG
jgi:hypothetical protein